MAATQCYVPLQERQQFYCLLNRPSNEQIVSKETTSQNGHKPKYPGVRVTCNGNQLVAQYVETRITEGGIFYPITP
jgi:hypothetical protein